MIREIFTKQESDLTFTKIYQDYYRRVYNYAFSRLLQREEAEDATAEVFLIVLQNLQRYDPKAEEKTDKEIGKAPEKGEDAEPEIYEAELHEDGDWYARVKLSEEERTFLALRYELDMTNAEIGKLMGLTPASVSQRYHRLLEKCRKLDGNP